MPHRLSGRCDGSRRRPVPRLAGRARRHPHRAAMHAGHRRRPGMRTAHRRGLPDPERVDTAVRRRKARPVMVWIHGGAFINGSGDLYDARWLATRGDIVVVTVNYRLGALGLPGASGAGPGRATSATTAWPISRRRCAGCATTSPSSAAIPARSRSPGESAGGMSVCDHLVAPGSAGLFRAAIIQSGPCQAQAHCREAEKRQPGLCGRGWAAAIRRPRRLPAALPAASCESRRGTSRFGDDHAERAGHRDDVAARRPDRRHSPTGARPGCRC